MVLPVINWLILQSILWLLAKTQASRTYCFSEKKSIQNCFSYKNPVHFSLFLWKIDLSFFSKVNGKKTPFGWTIQSLKSKSSGILPSGDVRAAMSCSAPWFLFWPVLSLLKKEMWLVEKKKGDRVLLTTFFFYKIGVIFTPFCGALCFLPAPTKQLSLLKFKAANKPFHCNLPLGEATSGTRALCSGGWWSTRESCSSGVPRETIWPSPGSHTSLDRFLETTNSLNIIGFSSSQWHG